MKDERICPSCGKPALPVATRCPKCGYGFETRYERPKAESSRTTGLFAAILILVIVALLASNALRRHGHKPAEPLREAGMPAPVTQAQADSSPAKAAPTVKPAESVAGTVPKTPQPVAPAPTPRPVVARVASTGQRYATTWINVRSARNSSAPVLRVLRPGEIVSIDSLDGGWYQVVTRDQIRGYADRRLLSDHPPPPGP